MKNRGAHFLGATWALPEKLKIVKSEIRGAHFLGATGALPGP